MKVISSSKTHHRVDGAKGAAVGRLQKRAAAAALLGGAAPLPLCVSRAGFTAIAGTAPWSPKGYTPDQIKSAYGISGFDGKRPEPWPSSMRMLRRRSWMT